MIRACSDSSAAGGLAADALEVSSRSHRDCVASPGHLRSGVWLTRSSRARGTRSGTSTRWATSTGSGRSAARSASRAFGVNAIALPPGYETGRHFHDEQEELYFCTAGPIEVEFGDGDHASSSSRAARPGSTRRTVRKIRNVGSDDAIYVIVGAKDGYVGRDGRLPEGETSRFGPTARRLPGA